MTNAKPGKSADRLVWAAMIRLASKRNRAHLDSGKAAFQVAALEEAGLGEQRFNKVFAVNVGLFSQQPTRELEADERQMTGGS